MKSNTIIVVLLVVIIVGAGGFFAGVKYQQGKQPSRTDFQSRLGMRQQNLPAGVQQRMGAGTVRGEIISRDKTSITVKLPDDSSKIILISENTEINKVDEASVDDLGTGEQIAVFGQENPDGSVTANSIQIGKFKDQ